MRRKWISPNIARIQLNVWHFCRKWDCVSAQSQLTAMTGGVFLPIISGNSFFVPLNYIPIQYWVNFCYTNANIGKTTTNCLLTNFFKSHYLMINKCIETFNLIKKSFILNCIFFLSFDGIMFVFFTVLAGIWSRSWPCTAVAYSFRICTCFLLMFLFSQPVCPEWLLFLMNRRSVLGWSVEAQFYLKWFPLP